MGNWKYILPTATTNLVTEPSFEVSPFVDWASAGTSAVAQSSVVQTRGAYSCLCTYGNSVYAASYSITFPAAGVYTLSCKLYVPSNWDDTTLFYLRPYNFVGSSYVIVSQWDGTTFDEWMTLETEATIVGGDLTGTITLIYPPPLNATVGRYFYIDEVQAESGSDMTTYCDGDQPGCAWSGARGLSTSMRSAAFRGGGLIKDLKDDYNFAVVSAIGVGMPPVTLSEDSYSLLPGGELNGIKTEIRPFTLTANIGGSGSDCDILPVRQTLEKLFAHDTYPKSGDGWQPIRLRFTGADVIKEANVHYARGLDGSLTPEALSSGTEAVAVGFEQPGVFWESINDGAQTLVSNDNASVRYIVARLKSTGQWDNMSVGATGELPYSISIGPDGNIYVAGAFATIDGVANTSRIAVYDPQTDTWSPLQSGATDGIIYATIFGADGTLYVGGTFTSMDNGGGPVANTSRIASWDGTNWAALGTGAADNNVSGLTVGHDGVLYACGAFTGMGGVANTAAIAAWSGVAWSSISSAIVGGAGIVWALATGLNGVIYVGGDYTSLDGVTLNAIGEYDPVADTWSAMDGGRSGAGAIRTLSSGGAGQLYAGGTFADIGSDDVDWIAEWNGTTWLPLGSGVDANVYAIEIAPDGMVYAGGSFTEAGGITLAQRAARWNGSSWAHLDIDLPGAPSVYSFGIGNADATIDSNYDVFIGFSTLGTAYFAGLTTATNDGNTPTYPTLVVNRSGGTTAILETLRNETTGLELMLDYSLLDGETLTIDLNPQAKTIISSMFGSRPDAMLAGSDFGEWALLPDDNEVTCFVSVAGAPTVAAYLLWPILYKGIE